MREADVETYFKKQVEKRLGGLAPKFVSPGLNGVPDRLVLLPGGRVIFVELKAPKKNLRKLQEYVCGKIRALGFTVLKIDTKEGVDAFIAEVQNGGI